MLVTISATVFPSEDPGKVSEAIQRIFPDASVEMSERRVDATAEDLDNFKLQLRKQRILDTARSVMLKGQSGGRTVFRMNKQVAFVGKISFAEERTVLGTIEVTVEDDDISAVIDATAPVTFDGEEIR